MHEKVQLIMNKIYFKVGNNCSGVRSDVNSTGGDMNHWIGPSGKLLCL